MTIVKLRNYVKDFIKAVGVEISTQYIVITVPTGRKRNAAGAYTVKNINYLSFKIREKRPEAIADCNQAVFDTYKLVWVELDEFCDYTEEYYVFF